MSKKPRVGRSAINLIKEAFEMGTSMSTFEAQEFLEAQGIARKFLPYRAVREWKRQAAMEVQKAQTASVANPVQANAYRSNSAPTPLDRATARRIRRKDTATRVHNDKIEAETDATRDDATPTELAVVDLYKSQEHLLSAIEKLSDTANRIEA